MSNSTSSSLEERERRLRSNLPIELVLIRHAEPDWAAVRQRGGGDPGLTTLGEQQAAALAVHLKDHRFDALYASPLQRARDTAAAIAKRQDIEPDIIPDLAEIRVPEMRDASQPEVEAYFAAAARRPFREHWNGFPGGESFTDFHQRVTTALDHVLSRHHTKRHPVGEITAWSTHERAQTLRLGIVAHGGTNSVLVTHLLGIPSVPWEWIRFETPLAAYSTLALRAFNEEGYIWSLQGFGRRAPGAH